MKTASCSPRDLHYAVLVVGMMRLCFVLLFMIWRCPCRLKGDLAVTYAGISSSEASSPLMRG
jgi:hypothetical protein